MEENLIQNTGLTRNESLTYLTLLKYGTLKASEILKKSNLNSGKIYEILEGLKNKGLVSESNINKVRFFTAAPPSELIQIIEKKSSELEQKKIDLIKELPLLEKARKVYSTQTKSITYTGLKGLKTAAYEALDSMKPNEIIFSMGVTGFKDEEINNFWKAFGAKRLEKKIKNKLIFSEKNKYFEDFNKVPLAESRLLPSITPATVDVFGGDKIIIFNYEKPVTSILIYDKNIATAFKQFFEQLWVQAKD